MARRKATTAKVVRAAKRNIRRAQLSRVGTRETRSVGRITRSRARYSRPAMPVARKVTAGRRR